MVKEGVVCASDFKDIFTEHEHEIDQKKGAKERAPVIEIVTKLKESFNDDNNKESKVVPFCAKNSGCISGVARTCSTPIAEAYTIPFV